MAAQSTVMKRLLVLSLMCAICLHSLDSHLTNGYYSGRLVHRTGAAHHQTRLYAAIDGRIAGESTGSSSSPGKAKYTKKQARKPRFVHPQVLKMYKRAQALLRNGNNEVAGKLLVRCLELNPYDSYSWLSLARLEVKLGNVIKARDIFQQSMENCPDNVHILHAWGHMEEV
jgi:tetratricopeptide (TPR) repeat protein